MSFHTGLPEVRQYEPRVRQARAALIVATARGLRRAVAALWPRGAHVRHRGTPAACRNG